METHPYQFSKPTLPSTCIHEIRRSEFRVPEIILKTTDTTTDRPY